MARLESDYTGDASTIEIASTRKVIAPGIYKALITQCDVAANKAGNGTNVVPIFQIVDGEFKGQTLTEWWCVSNPSEIAQRLGRDKKAKVGVILCGTPNPADTNLLLNKLLLITIDTKPDSFVGRDGQTIETVKNFISDYDPLVGSYKDCAAGKRASTPVREDDDSVEIPF